MKEEIKEKPVQKIEEVKVTKIEEQKQTDFIISNQEEQKVGHKILKETPVVKLALKESTIAKTHNERPITSIKEKSILSNQEKPFEKPVEKIVEKPINSEPI